jgi:hypothetical protein
MVSIKDTEKRYGWTVSKKFLCLIVTIACHIWGTCFVRSISPGMALVTLWTDSINTCLASPVRKQIPGKRITGQLKSDSAQPPPDMDRVTQTNSWQIFRLQSPLGSALIFIAPTLIGNRSSRKSSGRQPPIPFSDWRWWPPISPLNFLLYITGATAVSQEEHQWSSVRSRGVR